MNHSPKLVIEDSTAKLREKVKYLTDLISASGDERERRVFAKELDKTAAVNIANVDERKEHLEALKIVRRNLGIDQFGQSVISSTKTVQTVNNSPKPEVKIKTSSEKEEAEFAASVEESRGTLVCAANESTNAENFLKKQEEEANELPDSRNKWTLLSAIALAKADFGLTILQPTQNNNNSPKSVIEEFTSQLEEKAKISNHPDHNTMVVEYKNMVRESVSYNGNRNDFKKMQRECVDAFEKSALDMRDSEEKDMRLHALVAVRVDLDL